MKCMFNEVDTLLGCQTSDDSNNGDISLLQSKPLLQCSLCSILAFNHIFRSIMHRDEVISIWIPDIWINSIENSIEFSTMRSYGTMTCDFL
ncbi:Os08g0191466 [Oryza sativa Japonica Group]|uniref:Os08g0191466 protein n=1 Tax=Oryza sativa subsp. japonica TaxID=39947 RepID=A0A0P0XCJ2_ORYSJ|nr:hypothetical protein EE612_042563 [Oryza sativa]BAT04175.1 Os08g0191466 [Oryza sativa Japonica Group]